MKNNRGFTLIELLVTIALIAAVSVIVGLNIMHTINAQEEKQITEYRTKLEDAACVYVESLGLKGNRTVTIQNLIDKGLVGKDTVNPENKKAVTQDGARITVTWSNGKKTCTYTK